ncbi:kinase-like domain-containing protein, partial [Polychytrium aggregatum]|uniref:kinase-like domain-containing protein n=1 Tax=Polychytrium aggregatum TaxID=110093 RepID=UPI0022FE4E0A
MTSNGSIPFTKLAASDWQSWFIPAEAITHKAQNRLDGGGFADVFAARLGNMDVAVKQLRIHLNNYGIDVFEREIRVWHRLKHVNILPLLGACDRDAQGTPIPPFMVSPLMENGSMLEYIKKNQCYLNQKLSFLAQSAAGMNYLHSERIIHGDFKTANVLLDGRLNAVVADFGMSRTKRTSASAVWVRASPFEGGTPGFIAPEMLDPNDPAGASKKTDVYAFAITMYEVLNDGKEIWVTRDGQIMQIFQIGLMVCNGRRPKRIPGIPDDVWALIERCWAHDPADRPSFPEILAVLQ